VRTKKNLYYLLIIAGLATIIMAKFLPTATMSGVAADLPYKDTWRLALPAEIKTLNPQTVSSSIEKSILSICFSRLVKIDENFDMKGDLLESWTYNVKERKYILKLNQNVTFHNMNALTAKDVIFSFHVWAKKESLDSNLLLPIKGVDEYRKGIAKTISGLIPIGDYTIEIDLVSWSDNFILSLTMPRFVVFPKDFLGLTADVFFQNPVGTGPYKCLSSTEKQSFASFDKYFGGRPKTKTIKIEHLPANQALEQFKAGKLDDLIFYDDSDYIFIESLKDQKGIKIKRIDAYKVEAVIINLNAGPEFKDIKNRQAVRNAIEIKEIVEHCYPGEKPARNIIPSGLIGSEPAHSEPRSSHTADIATDTKLFKNTVFHISSEQNAECIKSIVEPRLAKLGIKTQITDFEEMFSLFMKGKLALWTEKFSFKTEDPFSILQYFENDSNEYLIGGNFPTLNKHFAKLRQVQTLEEKASIYGEIDNYLIDQDLVVPFVHYPTRVIYRDNVQNVRFAGNRHQIADWHTIMIMENHL
jgi:ABC-type transport system substrate-binding protein